MSHVITLPRSIVYTLDIRIRINNLLYHAKQEISAFRPLSSGIFSSTRYRDNLIKISWPSQNK